jgi:phage/conjugal plasmid C-4 type zinc finger TraR family protein
MSDTSDTSDLASKHEAHHNSVAIRVVVAAQQARSLRPTLTHCLECGEPIPEKRQEASPGCTLCIECQKWADKGGGFWP